MLVSKVMKGLLAHYITITSHFWSAFRSNVKEGKLLTKIIHSKCVPWDFLFG